jgi:hypothetical protein
MLRKIIVPSTQVKFSPTQIDSEIKVFDGGDDTTPPIQPPDGIKWCSIHVRELFIQDEAGGQFRLSFPKLMELHHSFFYPVPSHLRL